ncbi:MAG TPA: NnrS family protein, partial [Alcanivorax sp.]|nr:NnrS family protein [Alcanivorax sp.]
MDQDHAGNRPLPDFPLLRFPFRLFFISSALVGAILIPSWLWVWTHGWLGLALEPVSWHQHEMLAGFANAAVAGFLLTAICNWTGTPPLSGRRLLGLWLLWL